MAVIKWFDGSDFQFALANRVVCQGFFSCLGPFPCNYRSSTVKDLLLFSFRICQGLMNNLELTLESL